MKISHKLRKEIEDVMRDKKPFTRSTVMPYNEPVQRITPISNTMNNSLCERTQVHHLLNPMNICNFQGYNQIHSETIHRQLWIRLKHFLGLELSVLAWAILVIQQHSTSADHILWCAILCVCPWNWQSSFPMSTNLWLIFCGRSNNSSVDSSMVIGSWSKCFYSIKDGSDVVTGDHHAVHDLVIKWQLQPTLPNAALGRPRNVY